MIENHALILENVVPRAAAPPQIDSVQICHSITNKINLFLALLLISLPAIAEPTVIPVGTFGDKELNAVLPSEKAMILLAIALQVIYKLLMYIFKGKKKLDEKKEEEEKLYHSKVDQIFAMISEMKGDIRLLKAAPTEDQLFIRLVPHMKVVVHEELEKQRRARKP